MDKEYKPQFELAFIEELLQDGSTYADKKDKRFVLNEYPHYNFKSTRLMSKLHKWWLKGSDKLSYYKNKILSKLPQKISDKIIETKWIRFFILKTFHDSMITKMTFNNETLQTEIDYDDCFCKTPFGEQMSLVFNGVEKCSENLKEIIGFANDISVRIQSLVCSFENEKVNFKLDLACEWDVEKFTEKGKYWECCLTTRI